MIRIAICDDETCFVEKLRNILSSYSIEIGETMHIQEFFDGVTLLDKFDCKFDLIFLDVKMPYLDGVQVAEKIRCRDDDVTIVFLTSALSRAADGYNVNAANFLTKPVDREKVTREIDCWIETYYYILMVKALCATKN